MANRVKARLTELGIDLPEVAAPAGNYLPTVQAGNLLHVSGQLPLRDGEVAYCGRLGDGLAVDDGIAAARLCALNIVAQAKAALGDLDRVRRVVKLTGYVASAPDFTEQPTVINGASDLMADVFGAAGRHARAAVGVAALPLGAAVEIEAVLEVI